MERKKMLKFASLEGVGLEKSVADNYLWIILHEHNCQAFVWWWKDFLVV